MVEEINFSKLKKPLINVDKIVALKPDTIVVGLRITDGQNSAIEAQYFADLINKL